MDFTIYTLGDVESFRAALTAVSMLFSPSNTEGWVSNSSDIGLGYMAALALLIGLTFMLFRGAYTLKFELGQLLVGVIVYAIMFVPKFSVNIEDYYTGTIQRVDNVPLGIALPGSVISTMTREITMQFNTAFSTVDGNYISVASTGFLTPLKILNQLRYVSSTLPQLDPNLATSLKWFLIDCTAGRPEFDENIIRASKDPMTYLLTTAQTANINGLTSYYNAASPAGRTVTCQDSITRITADLGTFYSGASITASSANPSGLSKFSRMLSLRTKGGKVTTNGGYTEADYEEAFTKLAGVSGDEAKAFAITSLTSGLITKSRNCANSASSEADLARCLPLIQATYQYEEDAAASGTMFQRTMLNSMSIMLFLFYCFAPIVALLILMLGQQGLKILGGYMIFGVWTQSWLPVATIINFFIQNKVSTEFAKFGSDPSKLLTISEAPALYDMLATNVAIASDLMAATPILSLALLTGSFFALTGVATRLSGKDNYDEKVNSPTLVANAPVASNTSAYSGAMGTALFSQSLGDGGGISKSSAYTATLQSMQASQGMVQSQYQSQASSTWEKMFARSSSARESWDEGHAVGATALTDFRAAYQRRYGLTDNEMQQMQAGQETQAGQANTVSKTNQFSYGASAGFGTGGVGITPRNQPGEAGTEAAGPNANPGSAPAAGTTGPSSTKPGVAASSGKPGRSLTDLLPRINAGVAGDISHTEADRKEAKTGEEARAGTTATQAQGNEMAITTSGERNRSGSLSIRDDVSRLKQVAENLDQRYGSGFSSNLTNSLQAAESFLDQQQRIDQSANSFGTSGNFTAPELVNYMRENPNMRASLDTQSEAARFAYGEEYNSAVTSHFNAQRGTKLQALPEEDRMRVAELHALEQVDRTGFGRVMSTLYADQSLQNTSARVEGTDARIDQAQEKAAKQSSDLDATRDRVPDSTSLRGEVAGQTASVVPGLAKAERLKNSSAQEGRVAGIAGRAQSAAMGQVRQNFLEAKKHEVDPTYSDKREVIQDAVHALREQLPPQLRQNLLEAHTNLENFGAQRGTPNGARLIGSERDQDARERVSSQMSSALNDAAKHISSHNPKAYTQFARQISEAKVAAQDIATDNRVGNTIANGKEFSVKSYNLNKDK